MLFGCVYEAFNAKKFLLARFKVRFTSLRYDAEIV